MSQQNVVDLFDGQAATYDQSVVEFKYVGPQWIKQHLPSWRPSTPPRVLDLGCGTGTSTLPVKELFATASVTGVDISQKNTAGSCGTSVPAEERRPPTIRLQRT